MELTYFVDCIMTIRLPFNDGNAGLRVVKMLEAANDVPATGGVSWSIFDLPKRSDPKPARATIATSASGHSRRNSNRPFEQFCPHKGKRSMNAD